MTAHRKEPLDNLVDDTQLSSKLLLFNGTHFIGKSDASTASRDSSGGQLLDLTHNTQLAYVQASSTEHSHFVVAGHFLNGGGPVQPLQILPTRVEELNWLRKPASVAVSPRDGKFVYVSAQGSQSITIFSRNMEFGTIIPISVLTRPDERSPLGSMPSFRSIRRIAISPDQRHLYATLPNQATVVVMDISAVSGTLNVTGRVSNGDLTESGREVHGLAGAFGIHVSADGATVYVSSYTEGCVTVFEREQADGHLSYVDAIWEGERIFSAFEDLPLDVYDVQNISTSSTLPHQIPVGEVLSSPRDLKFFSFEGMSFLAVASSSPNWDASDGALIVLRWEGNAEGENRAKYPWSL